MVFWRNKKRIKVKSGFTLIELIISVFIIAFAALAIFYAFSGITLFVEETKEVVEVDRELASNMETLRSKSYQEINWPERKVEVELVRLSPSLSFSTVSVSLKTVNLSRSIESLFFKNKERKISFYIYRKGINYRQ